MILNKKEIKCPNCGNHNVVKKAEGKLNSGLGNFIIAKIAKKDLLVARFPIRLMAQKLLLVLSVVIILEIR